MFDAEQFYATPPEGTDEMLARYSRESGHYDRHYNLSAKVNGPYIDPHGGEGALLDALVARGVKPQECFAYEINPSRQAILRDKGYRVLGADFLEDWEDMVFGTWLLNPPWRQDAKHILIALERFKGGHFIALMSTANFKDPHTAEECSLVARINLMIEKGQADIKHLGSIFVDAERQTKAECTCIWIELPVKDMFDPADFDKDEEFVGKEYVENGLVNRLYVPSMVSRYQATKRALIARHQAQAQLNFYMKGIASPYISTERQAQGEVKATQKLTTSFSVQDDLLALKQCFWYTVYGQLKIADRAPSHFKDKFEKFAYDNAQLSFSEKNIQQVIMTFIENADGIMQESIELMFDKLTNYSPKNTWECKTWKTNHAFKVKNKVIIPNLIYHTVSYGWSNWSTSRAQKFLNDLDKIWYYLSGQNAEDFGFSKSTYAVLADFAATDKGYGDVHESQFFKLKAHKSGTVHIWFKDAELLKKFNAMAAAQKKWIDSWEAESCADQRERDKARQPADHVTVSYPEPAYPAPTGEGQLALI